MKGPVHFIWLGGEWCWQHSRAIETAKVHGGERILWTAWPQTGGDLPSGITVEQLKLPLWLYDHPIQLANVKDLYAWKVLHEWGGIYLDLDTISLRPAWDLLTREVCVSREFPEGDGHVHPYNSAVVLARKGAPVLDILYDRAAMLLEDGEQTWGAIGPHLLTEVVAMYRHSFNVAPYLALNGWSYHGIGDYYANPRDPGEHVRVIHLYSSDHPEWLEDRWMPTT